MGKMNRQQDIKELIGGSSHDLIPSIVTAAELSENSGNSVSNESKFSLVEASSSRSVLTAMPLAARSWATSPTTAAPPRHRWKLPRSRLPRSKPQNLRSKTKPPGANFYQSPMLSGNGRQPCATFALHCRAYRLA